MTAMNVFVLYVERNEYAEWNTHSRKGRLGHAHLIFPITYMILRQVPEHSVPVKAHSLPNQG